MHVHSQKLIFGISEVFLVLSLNIIIGLIVDQFSCREAEYFVFVVPALSWHRGMNCGQSALGLI